MKKQSREMKWSALCRQVVMVAVSVAVLLSCKVFEEIQVKADGSGLYRAELVVSAGDEEMLESVKEELADKPEYRIVEEGERDGEKYLIVERKFDQLEDLSDDSSDYSWTASKDGIFSRSVHFELKNKPGQGGPGPTEHRLTVKMPGKVVETSGEKISQRVVVWDRLAAGPWGSLQVKSRVSAISGLFGGWFGWTAAVTAGAILILVLRSRRRTQTGPCRNCGTPLSQGAKFCTKCGEAV